MVLSTFAEFFFLLSLFLLDKSLIVFYYKLLFFAAFKILIKKNISVVKPHNSNRLLKPTNKSIKKHALVGFFLISDTQFNWEKQIFTRTEMFFITIERILIKLTCCAYKKFLCNFYQIISLLKVNKILIKWEKVMWSARSLLLVKYFSLKNLVWKNQLECLLKNCTQGSRLLVMMTVINIFCVHSLSPKN